MLGHVQDRIEHAQIGEPDIAPLYRQAVFDLVVLLSLSNTVQNAIIGNDNSVTGGLIGALSLLSTNYLVVRFLFRHRRIDQIIEGSPTVLINNQMACRLGDIVVEKPGLAMGPVNPIVMGEMTVMIGEVGMGSPVVVTPMTPMAAAGSAMSSSPAQALGTENAPPMPPMLVLANAMNSAPAHALAQAALGGAPFIEPCPG